jgi:hypothetical protein
VVAADEEGLVELREASAELQVLVVLQKALADVVVLRKNPSLRRINSLAPQLLAVKTAVGH